LLLWLACFFFFSSRRRHTRSKRDWSSDVCSSDLAGDSVFGVKRSLIKRFETQPAGTPTPDGRDVSRTGDGTWSSCNFDIVLAPRSEERRVGKECRYRW